MAFLAAIKKRSDLRQKGVKPERDERDPATVQDVPWITELDPKRFAELPSGGKWMHYHDHHLIWPYWQQAQKLYREGKLAGVSNMKVSTYHERHRFGSGVIIFYCGPPDDEEKCKEVGKVILKETGYVHLSKKTFYKTDTQTLARGKQGFHKWVLEIPKENFDNFKPLLKEKNTDDEKINDINNVNNAPKPVAPMPGAASMASAGTAPIPPAPPAAAPKPAAPKPVAPLPGQNENNGDIPEPPAPPMNSSDNDGK